MISYGTNPIAWSNDDDRSLGAQITLEQCLASDRHIGFYGIEKGHKMPTEPDALKAVLDRFGLRFVSGSYSLNLLTRSVEAEKVAIQPHLDLLKAMGCKVCIVCETSNAIHGDPSVALVERPVLGAAAWDRFGSAVEECARHCQGQGIDLVCHHHMGTVVQTRDEVDRLMACTGPATKLLLDTGHAVFAGIEPASLARDYMQRIGHLHLKNVRATFMERAVTDRLSFLAAVRAGVFTVPGDQEGFVELALVLSIAAEHDYEGWLVIEAEQDPATYEPKKYQSMGLYALRELAEAAGLALGDE